MNILAIDTEYEPVNTCWAELGGYSFSLDQGIGTFRPWTEASKQALQALLDTCDLLIMHNQIADSTILMQHGIKIPFDKLHDTLVMAYVLRKPELGLKPLANSELSMTMTTMDELVGVGKVKQNILDLPISVVWPYACADADATRRLYFVLLDQLKKEPELLWVYENIERPLFELNCMMQIEGVSVDWGYLQQLEVELEETIKLLASTMRSIVGKPLSWGHSPSVQSYVYGTLEYPVQYTDDGRPTLDSKHAIPTLRSYREHPFLQVYVEYNHVRKIKTSYCTKLPKMAGPDGKLHPSFKQFGASTGRYSSAEPNLQNNPMNTELGKRVRQAFIAPKGQVWLGVDYSQIELRTLAIITGDKVLADIYHEKNPEIKDVHDYVVQLTGGVPRRVAKEITYGKMNGQSIYGAYDAVVRSYVADGLEALSWDDFVPMFKQHEQVLTVLPKHQKTVAYKIAEQGYISTYFGRRMYGNKTKGEEFRSLLSMPHQGTAADIMKLALPRVYRVCVSYGAKLIGTIHDEVAITCDPAILDSIVPEVVEAMENVWPFSIPIKVEVKIGSNWGEAH